jgi:hypothetical protein
MQRVLSKDLWTEIHKQARTAESRKGAIAYVTSDLIGFRKGDTLVVNASIETIRNNGTDAHLLRKLHDIGVQLYDCSDLHAKILLLDGIAVIGSGNMSPNSKQRLVEAAVISDHGSVVGGVASLLDQLVRQSSPLDENTIAKLCKIEVIRRGGRMGAGHHKRKTRIKTLGSQTWIIGVHELKQDPKLEDQRLIDRAKRSLQEEIGGDIDDSGWIKWGVRGRLPRECRQGDMLIQVSRSSKAKQPSVVVKAVPVLRKQLTERWTRFYIQEPTGHAQCIGWGQFQRLLRRVGYPRQVKANSVQLVEPGVAQAINENWNAAAKD